MVSPLVDGYDVTCKSLGLGSLAKHSQCRHAGGCALCTPAKMNVSRFHSSLAEEVYLGNKKNSALYKTVPQELLDKIFSHLPLSSAISAKSSCQLLYRCGPPLCRLTTKARNQPLVVFDLRCKSEKHGKSGDQLCCNYCKCLHPSVQFSERHRAKAPHRRQCKGSIYSVELNPHWFMGFRQLLNLIEHLRPYTPPPIYVVGPAPRRGATPQTYATAAARAASNSFNQPTGQHRTLRASPGFDRYETELMLRHERPLLSVFPEERSQHYPKRNFELPSVQIYTSPGCSPHTFSPLQVSALWLRDTKASLILVSKWTLQIDMEEQEQSNEPAILAKLRHYSFNLCPHLKSNDRRVVQAVKDCHLLIRRNIPVECLECTTIVRVSSLREKILTLPTRTSHEVALLVERNLGEFKSPTDPLWLAQLQPETEDGKQKSMPLCLQECCRSVP